MRFSQSPEIFTSLRLPGHSDSITVSIAGAARDGGAAAGDDRGDRVVAVAAVDGGLAPEVTLIVSLPAPPLIVRARGPPCRCRRRRRRGCVVAAAAVDRVVAGAAVEGVGLPLAVPSCAVAPDDVVAREAEDAVWAGLPRRLSLRSPPVSACAGVP